MIAVFDSSALIALMRNEPGAEIVEQMLNDTDVERYVHAINLCEVYYDFVRVSNEECAARIIDEIIATGIIVREDMDITFWREVGLHKGTQKRISLADCFCLTLARRVDGEIITADRGEFTAIANQGICKIRFIR